MSTASKRASMLMPVSALVLPAGVLLVARVILAPGPATIHAATEPGSEAVPAAVPAALSPAQKAALTWLNTWTSVGDAPSPMEKTEFEAPTPVGIPTLTPEPEPDPVEPALPPETAAVVTSVFGTASGALARIDGQLRRQGDVLPDGWTVARIDAFRGVVELTDPLGRSVERRVITGPGRDRSPEMPGTPPAPTVTPRS